MKSKYIPAVLALLAGCSLLTSCVKENALQRSGELRLIPSVHGLSTKTETAGEGARDENKLGDRLDVFFQGAESGNANFWKEYHLSNCSFGPSGELLSGNWMEDGLVPGAKYNVYVLVNGPEAAHRYIGSYGALRYLSHTDEGIHQVKQADGDKTDVGDSGFYTSRKLLMMDSAILNWTPVTGQSTQTINMQTALKPLKRAAAKIEVSISFDPTFLNGLITGGERPGAAMFKYDRFAFSSPAFAFGAPVTPDIRTAGKFTYANVNTVNDGTNTYSYKITTYSFARSWTAAEAPLDAPSLLVSIPMIGASETTYHYYRIPVTAPGELSLERNHIYKVSATINSKGSWKESDAPIPVNLIFDILPWTEDSADESDVDASQGDYFEVNPTEQAIWGDGIQSVTLKYLAPDGASIGISSIPVEDLTAAGATQPSCGMTTTIGTYGYESFYIDKDGAPQAATISGLSVNTAAKTITVTSEALANRAPKYIRFRLTCGSHTQDIYLRHFPTDNIQNIPGWYSYKLDDGATYSAVLNPVTAGWTTSMSVKAWDGLEENYTFCVSKAEYDAAKDPEKYPQATVTDGRRIRPTTYSWTETDDAVPREEFLLALHTPDNRRMAGSLANSIQGSHGTYAESYYYGSAPVACSEAEADYSEGGTWYKYTTYHKITYWSGYARKYYRNAATYLMARWEYDKDGYTGTKYWRDNPSGSVYWFETHMYDGEHICTMKRGGSSSPYYAMQGDPTGQTNNHMYVVQITGNANLGVLGYPNINSSTRNSNDNTISPAFMLASQLGITNPVTTNRVNYETPAKHCSRYVEVGLDSKVYTGWRLPTKQEIAIINGYQNRSGSSAVEIDRIFTAQYYSSLDGDKKEIESYTGSTNEFIRCVRDLTPGEVAKLNRIK